MGKLTGDNPQDPLEAAGGTMSWLAWVGIGFGIAILCFPMAFMFVVTVKEMLETLFR